MGKMGVTGGTKVSQHAVGSLGHSLFHLSAAAPEFQGVFVGPWSRQKSQEKWFHESHC